MSRFRERSARSRRSQYAPKPLPVRILRYLGILYLILTLAHIVITQFFIRPLHVDTAAMDPAIIAGQTVLVSPLAYGVNLGFVGVYPMWVQPERGDIVAFNSPVMEPPGFFRGLAGTVFRIFLFGARPPWEPEEPGFASRSIQVRRVVGLPGDRVKRIFNQYFVLPQGEPEFLPLDSVQVPADLTGPALVEEIPFGGNMEEVTVPDGSVFVAADRRGEYLDSSNYGSIPMTALFGKVFFRLRPLAGAGPLD